MILHEFRFESRALMLLSVLVVCAPIAWVALAVWRHDRNKP